MGNGGAGATLPTAWRRRSGVAWLDLPSRRVAWSCRFVVLVVVVIISSQLVVVVARSRMRGGSESVSVLAGTGGAEECGSQALHAVRRGYTGLTQRGAT